MKILVTGGAGFIGSNYIHLLFERHGDSVEVLNLDKHTYAADPRNLDGVATRPGYSLVRGDICDAGLVDEVVRNFAPNVLVHFAAETHVDRSILDGGVFVQTNLYGTFCLLEAARRNGVPRFVHVSTDEVYGSRRQGSFNETDPLSPSSPYSSSKAGSDLLALSYHHTYGLPVIVTRCTNNYGPRQHPEKLIPKVITLALANRSIPIYGTGENVRDWIHVRDHNEAIETLRECGLPGEVYNIAGNNEMPNLAVVEAILEATGRPRTLIQFVKDRPGHDWRYSIDASKLHRLGWRPKVVFQQGLADTIAWYSRRAREPSAPLAETPAVSNR